MANETAFIFKGKKRVPSVNGRALFYVTCLFLKSVYTERHGRQLVVEYRLLTFCCNNGSTFLWRDKFRFTDAVLIIHTIMAQSERLDGTVAFHACETEADVLCLA